MNTHVLFLMFDFAVSVELFIHSFTEGLMSFPCQLYDILNNPKETVVLWQAQHVGSKGNSMSPNFGGYMKY